MTDRFIDVVLADPANLLPMPGVPRLFSADGEKIDSWDGFWLPLLADGSIVPKPAAAPAPEPAAEPAAEPDSAADHAA